MARRHVKSGPTLSIEILDTGGRVASESTYIQAAVPGGGSAIHSVPVPKPLVGTARTASLNWPRGRGEECIACGRAASIGGIMLLMPMPPAATAAVETATSDPLLTGSETATRPPGRGSVSFSFLPQWLWSSLQNDPHRRCAPSPLFCVPRHTPAAKLRRAHVRDLGVGSLPALGGEVWPGRYAPPARRGAARRAPRRRVATVERARRRPPALGGKTGRVAPTHDKVFVSSLCVQGVCGQGVSASTDGHACPFMTRVVRCARGLSLPPAWLSLCHGHGRPLAAWSCAAPAHSREPPAPVLTSRGARTAPWACPSRARPVQ